MTTLAQPRLFRATPKKLGPAPRNSKSARDEFYRQLNTLADRGRLEPRVRDFLQVTVYAFSDETAADFFPSQETMAKLHGCSKRTISRRVAAAKSAGVLKVAQLKGYDPAAGAWFCSSNTHRPTFVDEFVAELKASRAAKRATARQARIGQRAQRPDPRGSAAPVSPDFDPEEARSRHAAALEVSDVPARAQALRELLRPSRPPPDA
jgi:hypothetical protein